MAGVCDRLLTCVMVFALSGMLCMPFRMVHIDDVLMCWGLWWRKEPSW